MSVQTMGKVECQGLRDKLISGGFVHPFTFENLDGSRAKDWDTVLDYEKCNSDAWKEQKARILKTGVRSYKDGEWVRRDYPEKYANEQLGKYQLGFSADGNEAYWFSSYNYDDDPAYYISEALPDEVLKFTREYEGRFDSSYYVKNGNYVTSAGDKVYDSLYRVHGSCIKEMPNGQMRISVPVDNTDKRFAQIYVPKSDVQPTYLADGEPPLHTANHFTVCLTKEKDIAVYRQFADGTKRKDFMTAHELNKANENAKQIYQEQKSRSRRLPKDAEEIIEKAEAQMSVDYEDDDLPY